MQQSYGEKPQTLFVKNRKRFAHLRQFGNSSYLYGMNNSHFKAVEEDDAEFYIYHVLTGNVTTEIHYHSSAQLVYAEGGIVHVLRIRNTGIFLPDALCGFLPVHHIIFFQPAQRLICITFILKRRE